MLYSGPNKQFKVMQFKYSSCTLYWKILLHRSIVDGLNCRFASQLHGNAGIKRFLYGKTKGLYGKINRQLYDKNKRGLFDKERFVWQK